MVECWRSGNNNKALFFAQMSCYLSIESDFVDVLIVWKVFMNSLGENEQPISVSLKGMQLFVSHDFTQNSNRSTTFCPRRLWTTHFWTLTLLCSQVHLQCLKLGGGWLDINRFDWLEVKQTVLLPKQDITLLFFSYYLKIPQINNQRTQWKPIHPRPSADNTVHPVLFL